MTSKSILFVDDELNIRKAVSTFLSRRGYSVSTAADGEEALRSVAQRVPDVVVSDVNMPKMDGYELTRRLRGHPKTAGIPILMLSALKLEDQILGGYQAGADDYIGKPVEMTVLAAKIEALLRRQANGFGAPSSVPASGRVITFLHAKGGVGTTTLLVNLAVAAAERSPERVHIIDGALPTGDVAVLLDLRPTRSLADISVADGEALDPDVLRQLSVAHESGLALLASPESPLDAERLTAGTLAAAIQAARTIADRIYVDTAPVFTPVTLAAIDAADLLCVITEPHLSSVLATKRMLDILHRMDIPEERLRVVVNRTTPRGIDDQRVWSALGIARGMVIPYSEVFWTAGDEGRALVSSRADSAAAAAIRDIDKVLVAS